MGGPPGSVAGRRGGAYNRVATLSAQRWGDMRKDVAEVRNPLQEKYLAGQAAIDEEAASILKKKGEPQMRVFLTKRSHDACE